MRTCSVYSKVIGLVAVSVPACGVGFLLGSTGRMPVPPLCLGGLGLALVMGLVLGQIAAFLKGQLRSDDSETKAEPVVSHGLYMAAMADRQELEKQRVHLEHQLSERAFELYRTREKLQAESRECAAVKDALQEQRLRQQDLLDAIPVPFYYTDVHQIFLGCNKAFEQFMGVSRDQIAGKSLQQWSATDTGLEDTDRDAAWLASGGRQVYKGDVLHADGSRRSVEFHKAVVLDKEGAIAGLAGTIFDLTDRKLAEEKHALLYTAVEEAAEAVLVTDLHGTIQYVNPAFESISGYGRAEVVGQNPRIVKSGSHGAAFYEEMWATLLRGEVWRGHLINRRQDGRLYETETVISPVHDRSGKIINYVALKHDVTQQVALEKQVRQTQKMEAIGRLAGGVAHDFNNLLMVIINNAEFVMDELVRGSQAREDLDVLLGAANRAMALTRQLLAFSRQQPIAPSLLNLNDIVTGFEKMLKRVIGEDVVLTTRLDPAPVSIMADPAQIEQLCMNLVVNARDAMPNGGLLRLETSRVVLDGSENAVFVGGGQVGAGPYVVLKVSDTGVGIPEDVRNQIFDPFFTTKEVGHGTGLGLSTVYGIVNQHRGLIAVESQQGQGTSFSVYIPQAQCQGRVPAESGDAASLPVGGETILLVEDEHPVRRVASRMLSQLGYKVLEAASGEEALQMEQSYPESIDLVLTDVIMPGMDGKTFADLLLKRRGNLKVIYASGYTGDRLEQHGVLERGQVLIQKPFSKKVLACKVRTLLDSPGNVSQACGNVTAA